MTKYPTFGSIPVLSNTSYASPICGACWKIINVRNGLLVYFTSINFTNSYNFILSVETFNKLNSSVASGGILEGKFEFAKGFCRNQCIRLYFYTFLLPSSCIPGHASVKANIAKFTCHL